MPPPTHLPPVPLTQDGEQVGAAGLGVHRRLVAHEREEAKLWRREDGLSEAFGEAFGMGVQEQLTNAGAGMAWRQVGRPPPSPPCLLPCTFQTMPCTPTARLSTRPQPLTCSAELRSGSEPASRRWNYEAPRATAAGDTPAQEVGEGRAGREVVA